MRRSVSAGVVVLIVLALVTGSVVGASDLSFATFNERGASPDGIKAGGGLDFGQNGGVVVWSEDRTGTGYATIHLTSLSQNYSLSGDEVQQQKVTFSKPKRATGLAIAKSGTRLYILDPGSYGDGTPEIFQYNLSEAYNLSTATFNSSLQVGFSDTFNETGGLAVDAKGSEIYVVDKTNDRIVIHNMPTAYEIRSSNRAESPSPGIGDIDGIGVSVDPNLVMLSQPGKSRLVQYNRTKLNGDLQNEPPSKTFDVSDYTGSPGALAYSEPGQHIWTYSGTDPIDFLLEETVAPSVDNSTASPAGGDTVTDNPLELSINVSDPNFDAGDSVTATWYVDGSQVNQTTVSSNGTASATLDPPAGGGHTWHVELQDSDGKTATSDTFSFSTPSQLEIRNESAPSDLVTNATVELRFYFNESSLNDPRIVTRNTTNGTLNMTGLPTDESFIAVARADGYYPRRIFVRSLIKTQRIYLLNESQRAVSVRFALQDYSGDYPSDTTVMQVQRALNGSWQTVMGDTFGATEEFPAQLRYNQRHRLVVLNTQTGEREVVGTFTPLESATQTITINADGDPDLSSPIRFVVRPGARQLPGENNTTVTATLNSSDSRLASWDIYVNYSAAGASTTSTLAQTSSTDNDGGRFAPAINLTDKAGGTVVVKAVYTINNGATISERVAFRVVEIFENQYGLLPVLQSVPGRLPAGTGSMVTGLLAVVSTIALMGVSGSLGVGTEAVGAVGVLGLAGFAVIGWIGYGIVFAGGAAWAAMAGLRRAI